MHNFSYYVTLSGSFGELRLREAAAVERPPAPAERRGGGLSPPAARPPSRPGPRPRRALLDAAHRLEGAAARRPPQRPRAHPGPPASLPRRPGQEPGPACAPGSPAPTEEVTWTHYYPV